MFYCTNKLCPILCGRYKDIVVSVNCAGGSYYYNYAPYISAAPQGYKCLYHMDNGVKPITTG
jgi:outer membrane protease